MASTPSHSTFERNMCISSYFVNLILLSKWKIPHFGPQELSTPTNPPQFLSPKDQRGRNHHPRHRDQRPRYREDLSTQGQKPTPFDHLQDHLPGYNISGQAPQGQQVTPNELRGGFAALPNSCGAMLPGVNMRKNYRNPASHRCNLVRMLPRGSKFLPRRQGSASHC